MTKYPIEALKEHENIVWEYATDFVEHFWKNGYKLASISFAADCVYVTIVADCGQYIGDSVSLNKYKEWLNTFGWYKESE